MKKLSATVLLLAAPALHAADQGAIVGGSEVLSMLVSLLIVVAAIIALGWLYSRSKLTGNGTRDVINVVASRALGTKERLLIVEVADQQLLLGMTANQVNTLHIFDKPIDIKTDEPAVGLFAEKLKATLSEGRK